MGKFLDWLDGLYSALVDAFLALIGFVIKIGFIEKRRKTTAL